YLMLGTYAMWAPRNAHRRFLEAQERAVALAGMTPELRVHRAHALQVFEWKFAEAESQFLKAQREKPAMTRGYGFLAMLYVSLGRFDEALRAIADGYKVDPLWPVLPAVEVSVRFFA